jgi:hypothetical protein
MQVPKLVEPSHGNNVNCIMKLTAKTDNMLDMIICGNEKGSSQNNSENTRSAFWESMKSRNYRKQPY